MASLNSLPSHSPSLPLTPGQNRGGGGQRRQLSLVGPEGAMFDIRNLTPKRKAYLKSLLETDGDNGDTQFDEEAMGSPLHNSPGRRKRRSHISRKRNLNNNSLTASPASPPQPGTASRVVKKSKKADSTPSSFKIVSPVSPAPVTAVDEEQTAVA
jgi:hypothetical protein